MREIIERRGGEADQDEEALLWKTERVSVSVSVEIVCFGNG